MICFSICWIVLFAAINIMKESLEKTELRRWRGKAVIKHKRIFRGEWAETPFSNGLFSTDVGPGLQLSIILFNGQYSAHHNSFFQYHWSFNNPSWQSFFVSYWISGTLFCGSLLHNLNILFLEECGLVSELGKFSGDREWFFRRYVAIV